MVIVIPESVCNRLDNYSDYIISSGATTSERAVEKVTHIVSSIRNCLNNDIQNHRLCPYWNFSGCGRGYKMIRIPDKWTKNTVWCVAFEDIDNNARTVRGIELESVLANKDKIVRPPYQMRLPLDEHKLRHIIRQAVRKYILNETRA